MKFNENYPHSKIELKPKVKIIIPDISEQIKPKKYVLCRSKPIKRKCINLNRFLNRK
jgi:hypothetical protein